MKDNQVNPIMTGDYYGLVPSLMKADYEVFVDYLVKHIEEWPENKLAVTVKKDSKGNNKLEWIERYESVLNRDIGPVCTFTTWLVARIEYLKAQKEAING